MRRRLTILFYDVILLILCYLVVAWFKPATVNRVLPHYSLPFIGFIIIWIFTSYYTNKYNLYKGKKIREQIVNITIGDFTAIGIGLFLIYLFKLNLPSRMIVIGTFFLSYILEIIFSIVLILNSRTREEEYIKPEEKENSPAIFPDDQYELADQEQPLLSSNEVQNTYSKISYTEKLKKRYLTDIAGLYDFLSQHINLENASYSNALVLNTHTLFNIEKCDEQSQYLFINLHKINDIKRINRFFIQINQNLTNQGYYVACMQTKGIRKQEIYQMFPPIMNGFVYLSDFIFHRVLPKLPVAKQIYFFVTKGRNRSISRAEAFGRLYACGFEVIAEKLINNRLYFISRKIKAPLLGNEPTYGLLVKLKRVGKDGKIIKVYKFRTMHPFSEYLQEYVYKNNQLDSSGKFKNDFRITRWGKLMRKVWIDELPMLINMIKGEMKLVGIRPISEHYLTLYSKKHQELRKKVKPGLLPPYYADMPKTIDDIEKSEDRYIQKYFKHHLLTDTRYFFRIVYNILFKNARSK